MDAAGPIEKARRRVQARCESVILSRLSPKAMKRPAAVGRRRRLRQNLRTKRSAAPAGACKELAP